MTDREVAQRTWAACTPLLQRLLPREEYDAWFPYIEPVSLVGSEITLGVPSQYFYEYIEGHFIQELQGALVEVIGPDVSLKYKVLVDSGAAHRKNSSVTLSTNHPQSLRSTVSIKGVSREAEDPRCEAIEDFDSQLNPALSFSNFFHSECNHFAYTIAESIAKSPSKRDLNPIFIYGPSGVGKTHLCHAIGLRIRELYPHLKVLYVSSHLFEQQYISATRANTTNDFINFYQQIDVLLIDDIQGLIGKKKTQLTFFQVFNHLYMLGKQIVLTSDTSPAYLAGMEERLVSRMAGSVIVELCRPDIELRRRVLVEHCEESGLSLSPEIIDFIAQKVSNNIRQLKGVFMSLIYRATAEGCNVTLSFVKKIIMQSVRLEKKEVTVGSIEEVVCDYYNVSSQAVRGQSRKQDVTLARQVIMYLAKRYTDQSLSAIGELIGGRKHTTVIHACRVIEDQLSLSSSFREEVASLETLIS